MGVQCKLGDRPLQFVVAALHVGRPESWFIQPGEDHPSVWLILQ